ncbi:autotransporter outer membrane beta-barrel domain-containing protein [Sphingomonas sp. PB2P19]|uniref:autotransporter outer membrane beta-barrel domain-containing protein n=1 Tax=Sphingomonas rhamnosi TaxID=3096156 RepID=UPI002FC73338
MTVTTPQTSSVAHCLLISGVSLIALMTAGTVAANAQALQPTYSPAANNGGGSVGQRPDIINVVDSASTITGDYALRGTSARRFTIDSASIADRNRNGAVISGYDAVAGRSVVLLGTQQKTIATTYPDQIQGTRVATLVYDNDRLLATASTDTRATSYVDTNAPVYGDLRLANIANSAVTIATGDKAKSVYDTANFALLTADSGSTLYNVTNGSTIVYDSRTATMDGADQDGLSQSDSVTVAVPVTTFSGVAFGSGDRVTDLASLKRYNTEQIALLTAGTIAPAEYERRIQAAATSELRQVTVRTPVIPPYTAPPTVSERLFIKLDRSTLITTADSQLVGVVGADGNNDGLSTLILAQNGSTIVNNGTIAQGEGGVGIRVQDAGSSLTNSATGVIGVGYEVLDRSSGRPSPSGFTDFLGYGTGNIAVRATDGATVVNNGIINVANRDIPNHPEDPSYGKANTGIAVSTGATASNAGTILIGGADSAVANTLGMFGGAAGMVAFNGGTVTNTADGVIRVGTSFAGSTADLAGIVDVVSINPAAGMTSLSGGGTLVNDGLIRIGSLAQNATGMLVGGDGNVAVNTGAITIDPSATAGPSARNVGIAVRGSSVAGAVAATNAATGVITIGGVNGVGLLVENRVAGGSARAVNDGTIIVAGGISVDRLRSYGVYVGNASSSAQQNGAVVLRGEGAIGVHARNGATVDVGTAGSVDFQGARQVGYYALGAGSTITGAGTTNVDTIGSTGLRLEGGATARGAGQTFLVSGANAYGIVATGASTGTTIDATGARITVSGAGATGLLVEGGATGLLSGTSDIQLTGSGTTAAIVDGQAHDLDGVAVGAPVAGTRLTSAANLASSTAGVTGYAVRNGGQLVQSGSIAFTGADSTGIVASSGGTVTNSGAITIGGGASYGIDLAGSGTSATHSGSIGGSGTGVRIAGGARFTNSGAIALASGTGILVDGATSVLAGIGTSPVSVGDGVAALRLVNGATLISAGSFTGGGSAHGVLVDTGAGALTLGTGTILSTGRGNALENAAGSTAIRLDGTTLIASGSGAAVHSAVALDPASVATLTAAGTNSIGFDVSGAGGAVTTGGLTFGNGLAITASGIGATGIRLNTTGAVSLGGTVAVTSAQGGSAVVGGPAASVTNTGTLRSVSTTAAVVDLTGGTRAFTNSGTIAAASAAATAILGGANGQSVTLSGGAVTGAVTLGAGNDVFLMTGGTLTGAFNAGGGNDRATFRGLTDANLAGVTAIAGNGVAGGSDALIFDATTSTGTRRITGFNTVALTNGSTLTADGNLILAGGTATIDASSTFFAGNGVRALIGAGAGGTATVVNAGTIDLTNGSSGPTDTLTIRGNYVGQNGTLKLQTVLAGDGAPSDRLIIDGGAVSGTTRIQVVNTGGLGARTTGDGIELVSAVNGGTTTALTGGTGFTLAGEHIDVGAFEYRLYASNPAGTSQSFFLRTQGPGANADPTYRIEVPLLAALPATLRRGDLAMLGTYHRRMGDEPGTVAEGFTVPGRIWGRALADDGRFRQRGDARPTADGHLYGFQLGVDLFRFGTAAGHHDLGVYGGYTDGRYSVRGFASGVENSLAGRLDPNARYAGVYWTYQSQKGLYVDTVVQHSWYGGRATAANGVRMPIDGTGILASVETGYAIPLSTRWVIEPQAQLIAQGTSIDDVSIANALVQQRDRGQLTGRLGLRTRARYETGMGAIQPYLRANLWKAFASTDRTLFVTDTATTVIATPNSALWGEAGAGLTWSLGARVSLYGEADYRKSLDSGRGMVGHSTSGTIGLKIAM